MRPFNSLRSGVRVFALSLVVSSLSLAGPVIFNRSLPSSLNSNVAGPTRSNIAWLNQDGGVAGGGFINGDNFSLPAGLWNVDSIAVWIVLNKAGDTPAAEFSNFRLYGGLQSSPASFGLISSTAVATRDWYVPTNPGGPCNTPNGEDYLGVGTRAGVCLPIYKLTFTTNLTIAGGVLYDFAADGQTIGPPTALNGFYNHATTAAFAGTPQPGSDNAILNWDTLAFADGFVAEPQKNSDINVTVTGNLVPEPSTISMLGFGLAAVIWNIRRRRS